MRFKLFSSYGDFLELNAETVRPSVNVTEIYFDGAFHPWNTTCVPLEMRSFEESFDTVKGKLIEFYKTDMQKWRDSGFEAKAPYKAELSEGNQVWKLNRCKFSECEINEDNKTIYLKVNYDGVGYEKAN